MSITLYHNPLCSKSRQTLALLEERNLNPDIVFYLETPPSEETLEELLKKLGISARELMRKGEAEYKEHQLNNPALTEAELISALHSYPKLIERPIVVSGNAAKIGRPPESVLEIL